MREDKDRSGRWMLEHHGDAILRVAGLTGFLSWRGTPSDLALPRQAPDGLFEVTYPDVEEPDLVVIEISTYPERKAEDQALRDATMVFLDRRVLPDVVTLVLRPRGTLRLEGTYEVRSRSGRTRLPFTWHVVEMWTLPAQQLLALNDVGAVPLVALTQLDPPELMLQQCRDRIDQQAPPQEQANLLAVCQVMTRLRYNDPSLLSIFGGMTMVIESPFYEELLAFRQAKDIGVILQARFGSVPQEVQTSLEAITDQARLEELLKWSAVCPDLDAFRARCIPEPGSAP
jgi:predicted transposase YdaD